MPESVEPRAPRVVAAPTAHRLARVAIVVVGAVGLAVVARTAAFYLDVDRVAFALALLIGAGLCGGIAELLGRVARVARTEAELSRLPRPATIGAIDAATPALRTVLRARLAGQRATVPTAGFASYLVGVLVMIGLLGTFLGLVDALRGAREALGAGSDIAALRSALATPMLGLGRAFGISAAGLTASAMLGLASVLARRTEVSLALAVHAYGDDELGPLTTAQRQLDLAERHVLLAERQQELAERQIALLESMAQKSAESATASARGADAVLAATAAVRADVAAGVASVGKALATGVAAVGQSVEASLTPALERAVTRAAEVTREQLTAWSAVVERESEARRARDAELASRWAALASESAERVAREGGRVLSELRGALGESLASLDRRLAASVDGLAGQLAARTTAATEDLERRLAELTTTVGVMMQGLSAELEGTRSRLDRTLEVTTTTLEGHAQRSIAREQARADRADAREQVRADRADAHEQVRAKANDAREKARTDVIDAREKAWTEATAAREQTRADATDAREQAQAASLEARTTELAAAEARALTRLERHIDAVDASLSAHLERMTATHLEASQGAVQHAVSLQAVLREHAAALTARAAEVLAEAGRRAEAAAAMAERVAIAATSEAGAREASDLAQALRAAAVLDGLSASTEQMASRVMRVLDEQTERQSALEARWLAAHDASATRLVTLLGEHANGLDRGLDSTRALVDDAAGLLRASGVEMGAVAEVFTTAVDRYRDASAASLQALVGIDDAVDRAGKKAAIELLTDYLDQTREVFDHSLEVQRELFAELRALRVRGHTTPPESTRVRA